MRRDTLVIASIYVALLAIQLGVRMIVPQARKGLLDWQLLSGGVFGGLAVFLIISIKQHAVLWSLLIYPATIGVLMLRKSSSDEGRCPAGKVMLISVVNGLTTALAASAALWW